MYLFVSLKIMRYESLLRHLDSKTAILQIPPQKIIFAKETLPYIFRTFNCKKYRKQFSGNGVLLKFNRIPH